MNEAEKPTSSSAIAALQGGLVMAKSGRLELREIFTDNIGLHSTVSTAATYLASKEIEKRKIRADTPFKVIQGHLRSSRSVAIESPYATSY